MTKNHIVLVGALLALAPLESRAQAEARPQIIQYLCNRSAQMDTLFRVDFVGHTITIAYMGKDGDLYSGASPAPHLSGFPAAITSTSIRGLFRTSVWPKWWWRFTLNRQSMMLTEEFYVRDGTHRLVYRCRVYEY
jgi:hypothetical protein